MTCRPPLQASLLLAFVLPISACRYQSSGLTEGPAIVRPADAGARDAGAANPRRDVAAPAQPEGPSAGSAPDGGVDVTGMISGAAVDAAVSEGTDAASPPPVTGGLGATSLDAAPAEVAPADASPGFSAPAACRPTTVTGVRRRLFAEGARGDDIAFDRDGHLVTFDRRHVVRLSRQGEIDRLATDLIGSRGGALQGVDSGELYVADFEGNAVFVLAPGASPRRLPGSVPSPMKMTKGLGNSLYVTGKEGILTRIDLATGTSRTVRTLPFGPGGLASSPDQKSLYVGGITRPGIYVMDVQPEGGLSEPRLWRAQVNRAQALVTDACGQVYFISEGDTRVRRVRAEGEIELVADLVEGYPWAIAFGSGQLGWSADALYAQEPGNGRIYELPLSVAGPAATTSATKTETD